MAKTDSTFSVKGNLLIKLAKESLSFGIPSFTLKQNQGKETHPLEIEMLTMINLSRILYQTKNGFFDYTLHQQLPFKMADKKSFSDLMNAKGEPAKAEIILAQGAMSDSNYRDLANGIYQFFTTHLIDSMDFTPKEMKEFKNDAKPFAIENLRAKGYLSSKTYSEPAYEKAIFDFKVDNGLDSNTTIDAHTLEALSESNFHRLTRAAIGLDKLRQRPKRGPKFVWINIPTYQLFFYANDSLKAIHKLVVGKQSNPTPELVSEIRRMIIFPYWKVPASIIKKEIMPEVYKNPSYLARHRYKLCKFDDTARINPNTINWSNKPRGFSIIQMPGRGNSLGIIKFEFLNNSSVYVHDTPQKGFFNRAVRSFSHGCMRCQDPVELGKWMIKYDQEGRKKAMPPDTLDSLIRIGKHTSIALKEKIPIYIEYQTVTTFASKLVFHLDIYFREEEIIKILRKNQLKNNSK
jgi:murein L,D-transpeptidase YcbB/YkuD